MQDCRIDIISIDISGDMPAFAAPSTVIAPRPGDVRQRILAPLAIDWRAVTNIVILDSGLIWHVLELDSLG